MVCLSGSVSHPCLRLLFLSRKDSSSEKVLRCVFALVIATFSSVMALVSLLSVVERMTSEPLSCSSRESVLLYDVKVVALLYRCWSRNAATSRSVFMSCGLVDVMVSLFS